MHIAGIVSWYLLQVSHANLNQNRDRYHVKHLAQQIKQNIDVERVRIIQQHNLIVVDFYSIALVCHCAFIVLFHHKFNQKKKLSQFLRREEHSNNKRLCKTHKNKPYRTAVLIIMCWSISSINIKGIFGSHCSVIAVSIAHCSDILSSKLDEVEFVAFTTLLVKRLVDVSSSVITCIT